jgi:hypothetical protein
VTTIDRTDPDPSLFKIPEGYTVMDMPSAFDRPHPTSQPAQPQQ